jgi:beta-N-acetylhexosaminidase
VDDRLRAAGRVLLVGLPGPALIPDATDLLGRLRPAGVILFSRNLETVAQTSALLEQAGALLRDPPLLALDQEGGRVSRLRPWIGPTPSAAVLACAGRSAVSRFGRATARALRAVGFNVDFAPVVDLCEASATNGIGDRSFGTDPERVAALAGAFLDGLQGAGVAGCLKHFPGLGPTAVDSHEELPVLSEDRGGLEQAGLLPFRRLAARAAMVMVGHVHVPAIDPTPGVPASLSRSVTNGLLRGEIGFRGLVVGDDMDMGAVAPQDGIGRAAVAAIDAGCDLLIYGSRPDRARRAAEALARAADDDAAFAGRLAEAGRTVERTARSWTAAERPAANWEASRRELRALAEACPAESGGRRA